MQAAMPVALVHHKRATTSENRDTIKLAHNPSRYLSTGKLIKVNTSSRPATPLSQFLFLLFWPDSRQTQKKTRVGIKEAFVT
jgi:hypothetical protein